VEEVRGTTADAVACSIWGEGDRVAVFDGGDSRDGDEQSRKVEKESISGYL
jgi:hypothetical protein